MHWRGENAELLLAQRFLLSCCHPGKRSNWGGLTTKEERMLSSYWLRGDHVTGISAIKACNIYMKYTLLQSSEAFSSLHVSSLHHSDFLEGVAQGKS